MMTFDDDDTLDCGLDALRKPRAVPPPLPSPAPAAGRACPTLVRPSVRPRTPRPWSDSPMDYYIQMLTTDKFKCDNACVSRL